MQFNETYEQLMEGYLSDLKQKYWDINPTDSFLQRLAKNTLRTGTNLASMAAIGATPGQLKRLVSYDTIPRHGKGYKGSGHQELLGKKSERLKSAYINIGTRGRLAVRTQFGKIDQRINDTIKSYINSLQSDPDRQLAFMIILKDVYGTDDTSKFMNRKISDFIDVYNHFVSQYVRKHGKDPVFNPDSKRARKKSTAQSQEPEAPLYDDKGNIITPEDFWKE